MISLLADVYHFIDLPFISVQPSTMSSSDEASAHPSDDEEARILDDADENTLRIMLCTDNHLGYAEKDPVRGMDSFAAFEEVLYLAKEYKVCLCLPNLALRASCASLISSINFD